MNLVMTFIRFVVFVLLTLSSSKPFTVFHSQSTPTSCPAQTMTASHPIVLGRTTLLDDGKGDQFKVGFSEVVRGDSAWQRLQQADPTIAPAENGKEYLMALVVTRYISGTSATSILTLKTISHNEMVDAKPVIGKIKPTFEMVYKTDEFSGGWIASQVYKDDPAPLLFVSLNAESCSTFLTK